MQRLIVAVLLIAGALVLSVTVSSFEKKALCELRVSVAEICSNADKDEINAKDIAECIGLWENKRTFLSSVLKHADVDSMSQRYAMIQTYYESEERDLYVEVCSELVVIIDVILDGEILSFRNLF